MTIRRRLRRNEETFDLWRVRGRDRSGYRMSALTKTEAGAYGQSGWRVLDELMDELARMGMSDASAKLIEPTDEALAILADAPPMKLRFEQSEFALHAPLAVMPEEEAPSVKLKLLGIVVNPKINKPALATHRAEYVSIRRMDDAAWPKEGTGSYEGSCEDDQSEHGYGWPCAVSGCVRVHTPDGVKSKGMGYGTSLYVALALGVERVAESESACISSGDVEGTGRSSSARKWWSSQSGRGLVKSHETEGEPEEFTEDGVDVTREFRSSLIGESYGEGEISHVNTIDVDISGTREGQMAKYDTLAYEDAVEAGLVIASIDGDVTSDTLDGVWESITAGKHEVNEVHLAPIIALDVRGLSLGAINLLGILAQHAGATETQLDHLRLRWETNMDPETPIQQLRLLPNPGRRDASEAIEEAAAMRKALGWVKWADDEDY